VVEEGARRDVGAFRDGLDRDVVEAVLEHEVDRRRLDGEARLQLFALAHAGFGGLHRTSLPHSLHSVKRFLL
jgi:hypothetical protein